LPVNLLQGVVEGFRGFQGFQSMTGMPGKTRVQVKLCVKWYL